MSSFIRLYEEAVKHDSSKLPWDLLPYDAIEDIVKVLQYGAKKYSAHNCFSQYSPVPKKYVKRRI